MSRADHNQKKIIEMLRQVGASVQPLTNVGGGCPDLMVGFMGKNHLMEIKNVEGRNRMTAHQIIWHDRWRGSVAVVETWQDAYNQIGVITS